MSAKPPFRAEHIGSFVRPKHLIEARSKFNEGKLPAEELHAIEDQAIRDVDGRSGRLGPGVAGDLSLMYRNFADHGMLERQTTSSD